MHKQELHLAAVIEGDNNFRVGCAYDVESAGNHRHHKPKPLK